MNDRSIISMKCSRCYAPIGALDVPIKWRSLADWLEKEDINPLCSVCYNLLKIVAIQDKN